MVTLRLTDAPFSAGRKWCVDVLISVYKQHLDAVIRKGTETWTAIRKATPEGRGRHRGLNCVSYLHIEAAYNRHKTQPQLGSHLFECQHSSRTHMMLLSKPACITANFQDSLQDALGF